MATASSCGRSSGARTWGRSWGIPRVHGPFPPQAWTCCASRMDGSSSGGTSSTRSRCCSSSRWYPRPGRPRLARPAFQHDRIEAFAAMMIDATLDLIRRWRELPAGQQVDLTDEMTGLTTRIVALALFSVDITDAIGSFGQSVQAMNEFMGAFD